MLKLQLQYFGHLIRRPDSLEKSLMLRILEGKRRRGRPKLRWIDGITEATNLSLARPGELTEDRKAWKSLIDGITQSRSRLNA
ncbi:hypothetical protein M513_11788 [Trichuris suis]|uniref:Reverse transcriptase domain-containing protein n=1 Tax=Trichuris suis TaxID=68888 RepID=A0A085LQT4_9BILA|nr:hypothetical protein M513_11788 [Trichuris suis]